MLSVSPGFWPACDDWTLKDGSGWRCEAHHTPFFLKKRLRHSAKMKAPTEQKMNEEFGRRKGEMANKFDGKEVNGEDGQGLA